jgi:hypothetical protein
MPVEMAESGSLKKRPGSRKAWPLPDFRAAVCIRVPGSKPNLPSVHTVITSTPVRSSTALMIWTHVVASIPPKIT